MVTGHTPRERHGGWRRAVSGACLLAPCVALLCVPIYARGTPIIYGVPYFYWYMFAWVLGTPLLMVIAYLLRRRPSEGHSS